MPGLSLQISVFLVAVAAAAFFFGKAAGRRMPLLFAVLALAGSLARAFLPWPWLEIATAGCQLLAGMHLFVLLLLHPRKRIPRIVGDLVLVVAYVGALLAGLSLAGVNLYALITTSAVLTALIGLAMQETLTNLLAGISLQIEQSIRQGDWIKVAEGSGIVRMVRLRHTLIETADHDHIVVPNQQLTKTAVTLIAKKRRRLIPFILKYGKSPSEVIELLESALRAAPMMDVAQEPAPRVIVTAFQPGHVEYGVYAWLLRPGRENASISGVLTRVYFALARAGFEVGSIPSLLEFQKGISARERSEQEMATSLEILGRVEILQPLEPLELRQIANRLQQQSFAPGEVIIRQGDTGDSLYFVASGRVQVTVNRAPDLTQDLAQLGPGEFFGEMSLLTGEHRAATVKAISAVECRVLQKDALQEIFEKRPELVEEISRVLIWRQQGLDAANQKIASDERARQHREQQAGLAARIQKFFGTARATAGLSS